MTHTHAAFAAFLALTLACVSCPSADAAVLPLYSEQVSGDIDTPLHQFALQSGVSSVSGVLNSDADISDQFRFTVGTGLQINGISIQYETRATSLDPAVMGIRHLFRNDIATSAASIEELISGLHPGDSGYQELFDSPGGFSPIGASASVRSMYVGFESWGASPGTSLSYIYTLNFDVGAATPTATVPEPSALHLTTAALGLCGLISVLPGRRTRRKVRPDRAAP